MLEKWKIVFMTLFLIGMAPIVMHAEENEAEQEPKQRKGIISGVVDVVADTVSSAGNVVNETVEMTGKTVQQTVEFTEDTVKSVAEPPAEKPVKQIVERTAEFVQGTVENTIPVVNQTTETVRETAGNVTEITEEVPIVSHANPVVEETVDFTSTTADRTVNLVNESVNTVTASTDKPIKRVVEDTADFISETVNGTVPIVEETTEMVQGIVQDVARVTEELPELPVVTPVVDQTTELVKDTVDTVKGTTDQTVYETVDAVVGTIQKPDEIVMEKEPEFPSEVITSEKQNTEIARVPSVPLNKSNFNSKKEPDDLELEVESEDIQKEAINSSLKSDGLHEASKAADLMHKLYVSRQFMEQQERTPVGSNSSYKMNLPGQYEGNGKNLNRSVTKNVKAAPFEAFITTGSSSITTTSSSVSSSHVNISADLSSEYLVNVQLVSNRWYLESTIGKLQWVHEPPGQPPQTAPFLYVSV